jgi:hypothetical protein
VSGGRLYVSVIASESEAIQTATPKGLDCFAIARNDGTVTFRKTKTGRNNNEDDT